VPKSRALGGVVESVIGHHRLIRDNICSSSSFPAIAPLIALNVVGLARQLPTLVTMDGPLTQSLPVEDE